MDTKKAKFLDIIFKLAGSSQTESDCTDAISALMAYDLASAIELWEYLLVKNEGLLNDQNANIAVTEGILDMLYTKNEQRAVKVVAETPAIKKALYQSGFAPCENKSLEIIISCLMSSKLAAAEDIFKYLNKNTFSSNSYGENMKIIIEKLFMSILKKMGGTTKKVDLNKKLAALLLNYIKKITGPERALLEQRIKEVL